MEAMCTTTTFLASHLLAIIIARTLLKAAKVATGIEILEDSNTIIEFI